MSKKRKCWYDSNQSCRCDSDDECLEIRMRYAKLVWCNDKTCLYNQELPEGSSHTANKGKMYKPFLDDVFTGFCTREDVALSPKIFVIKDKNNRVISCTVRSDKKFSHGRLPYPDEIDMGTYPDPVDPHAAYHG